MTDYGKIQPDGLPAGANRGAHKMNDHKKDLEICEAVKIEDWTEVWANVDDIACQIYIVRFKPSKVHSMLTEVAELREENERLKAEVNEYAQHEMQTHDQMQSIVGNSDNFVRLTRQLQTDLAAALEQNRELMREILEKESLTIYTGMSREKILARLVTERGWPDDLFEDGGE